MDSICKYCGWEYARPGRVLCSKCYDCGLCAWCGHKPIIKGEKLILWSHACEDCYGK